MYRNNLADMYNVDSTARRITINQLVSFNALLSSSQQQAATATVTPVHCDCESGDVWY